MTCDDGEGTGDSPDDRVGPTVGVGLGAGVALGVAEATEGPCVDVGDPSVDGEDAPLHAVTAMTKPIAKAFLMRRAYLRELRRDYGTAAHARQLPA